MTRIDAHQHFWRTDRRDYGWLTPESGGLYRDFLPDDLKPLLDGAGVAATVLVQAAPTDAETRYLLDLADRYDWIAGVVGWTDLASPHALHRISALAEHPKLVGIRPMLQDLDDPDWILRQDVRPGLYALATRDLVFDALVRPRQLAAIIAVADRFPDLRIVVDHAAKPDIGGGISPEWVRDIATIATRPNVVAKMSGLLTEAPPGAGPDALRPVVDTLIAHFGTDRLLWGSDWPMLTLAGGYQAWHDLSEALLDGLAPDARAAIFGGNAARIYKVAA